MDIDVILFDWGGTLSQVTVQDDKFRQWCAEAGRLVVGDNNAAAIEKLIERVLDSDRIASADPELREADLVCYLCDWATGLGKSVSPELRARCAQMLDRTWIGSLEVLPGSVETLQELRRRGYRMGLVSNCMLPHDCSLAELTRHGLSQWLDFAVFSSDVGYRKPARAIYMEALRQAYQGTPPADLSRVLFVGDSPMFDCVAPAKLGMKTALIVRRNGLWAESDYAAARPDLTLHSVTELPGLLSH